ncbi:MFS transporter [Actinoalloteichus sp. AHMU CJ021]|uniref:Major Facilitator Superfamily protein n=1 Tax=Actinoalloteichus caeruleus DSM 43889 TaxID=1120930 RepID=A0ABT1JCE7_ACTCY|nr:MFS transporter [Actinoalloteichus caeruleus]AUS80728.1 MFS transporter [Actinoalloteichus sp. AHMU CJ021]MCP2330123.1 Major Facilitator Superfamily protein [Actinoalloteichus caeruleus DSM 43889]
MPVATGPSRSLGRRFWNFWSASFTSNLTDGIAMIALPWIATHLTDNPVLITLVASAGRAPWLLLALPAGVLVDRFPRLDLMLVANGTRVVLWAVLAALMATDLVTIPVLTLIAFGLGMMEVLYDTAAESAVPALVSRDNLERANGHLRTAEISAQEFIGRPVGGFVITLGLAVPLLLNALATAVSAMLLAVLSRRERRLAAAEGRRAAERPAWRDIGVGVTTIWRDPLLRRLVLGTVVFNGLYSMVLSTQVLFAQNTLALGSVGFGLLMVATAVGGVTGGQLSGWLAARLPRGSMPMLSLLGAGCCFLLMALFPVVPVAMAAYLVSSAFVLTYSVAVISIRQRITPSEILGRVNAAARTASWGVAAFGMVGGGVVVAFAERFLTVEDAPRIPFVLTALGAFGIVLLVGRSTTRLARDH